VHLGTAALLNFFDRHCNDESLVLVSLLATEGSTYRKPGALMLISGDNAYEGMISGGCLEGDLLHHADEVFISGDPKAVTYDMHAGDELVWGMGLGCDGVIHLLLQKLDRERDFPVLEFIRDSLIAREPILIALVGESNRPDLPLATLALKNRRALTFGNEVLINQCERHTKGTWPEWRHKIVEENGCSISLINIQPRPRILLCGAGPDAVPVAGQITNLGWECFVTDHRPAFARAERFPENCRVTLMRPEKLHDEIDLTQVDAAVIMSHHLENDAAYLQQLTSQAGASALRYIGVLGPTTRRDRLREMANCTDELVYGPVGLDIGAELPESIALSILAEIHAVLNGRDGQSLTTGPVGGNV
jgi:xanthine dehydrogenase accessory factor